MAPPANAEGAEPEPRGSGVSHAVRAAAAGSGGYVKTAPEASPYATRDLHAAVDAVEAESARVAARRGARVAAKAREAAEAARKAAAAEDVAVAVEEVAATAVAPAPEEVEEPPARKFRAALFAWESLHSVAVGGVAPHLTELAAGLERRGHEVHVYVRSGAGQAPYELIDGVHVHRVSFDLSSDFVQEITNMCNAMVHFMLETERFMDARFDVVHCHDWLAAPALINIKHNHNRPCVFTVHSTEYGRCGNKVFGGQSARIRGIEQEAVAIADRVIAVSGVLCDEIKAHYQLDWDKLRCVYNGINCLRYDGALWDPAEVRAKYGVGPLDPMVLTVGRMVVQKGIDILVEAVPSVLANRPDAKFIIVGDGYMKPEIEARAHELGVAGSIRFTGSMGGQGLVDLYKATDLVAIPSRNEPFGIVCLEAWASSKPIVVTQACGPRDFVWHDNDGYLVETNPEGIAWGITAAFSNFAHMKYMGERGRVKAAFQFSWNRIAGDTENVYGELLGR